MLAKRTEVFVCPFCGLTTRVREVYDSHRAVHVKEAGR